MKEEIKFEVLVNEKDDVAMLYSRGHIDIDRFREQTKFGGIYIAGFHTNLKVVFGSYIPMNEPCRGSFPATVLIYG